MTAKKHTKRTAAKKTTMGRDLKDTADKAVTSDPSAAVETAEIPNAPPTGATRLDIPRPSEADTIEPAPMPPVGPSPAKKLSALDAAARVLGESGQAMSGPELIAAMAAKGYWISPKGRTPAATLYAALLRELQTKGDQARFCKTGRGKFALRRTV